MWTTFAVPISAFFGLSLNLCAPVASFRDALASVRLYFRAAAVALRAEPSIVTLRALASLGVTVSEMPFSNALIVIFVLILLSVIVGGVVSGAGTVEFSTYVRAPAEHGEV